MLDKDPQDLQTTVQTNLVGAMLVTKVWKLATRQA